MVLGLRGGLDRSMESEDTKKKEMKGEWSCIPHAFFDAMLAESSPLYQSGAGQSGLRAVRDYESPKYDRVVLVYDAVGADLALNRYGAIDIGLDLGRPCTAL